MKRRDLEKILKEYGYVLIRSNKHYIYSNGQNSVAVPMKREYTRGLTRRILEHALIEDSIIRSLI